MRRTDTAKDIYKNTTVEHVAFLKELKKSQELRDRGSATVIEVMQVGLSANWSIRYVETVAQDMNHVISRFESSSGAFLHALDESMGHRRGKEEEVRSC